ncbi:MAG: sensor domain-containing diguanylate cyclase [Spirochaetia bacterium]|nr:sensor domain-containing diguanylate cyclase [Spirochaetia bacterium]
MLKRKNNRKINLYLFIILLLVFAASAAMYFTLEAIEKKVRQNYLSSLKSILNVTHESLQIWKKNTTERIKIFSKDDELNKMIKKQLEYKNGIQKLNSSASIKKMKSYFNKRFLSEEENGFFVIDLEYVNIASSRESNIGLQNFLAQNHKQYIQRAFKGETVFIPPVKSDVAVKTNSGKQISGYPSIYVLTPVYSDSIVISVLGAQIDPYNTFSKIAHIGRMGNSGETYFFNSDAKLLTSSRFEERLVQMGLLKEETPSILNVDIRDPGGNLLEGYVSEMPREKQPFTVMAQSALKKNNSSNDSGYNDYRGVLVIGAWLWDNNIDIGITTEIDLEEALESYHRTRITVIFMLAVVLFFVFGMFGIILIYRHKNEASLRQAAAVFSNIKEGIVITDTRGVIEDINSAFEEITGYSAKDVLGKNINILNTGTLNEDFYMKMWNELREKGSWKGDFRNKKANGEMFVQESSIVAIRNHKGNIIRYASIFSDITERKDAELVLKKMSITDGLTGIPNRRMFDDILKEETNRMMRTKGSLALVLIDVDFFKQYNDKYGHLAGDECLQKLARVFQNAARRSGELSARYGGEEFAVILPSIEKDRAFEFAERIRLDVEKLKIPHELSKAASYVTISLGVGYADGSVKITAEELLKKTDASLYEAKKQGRNRVVG